MRRLVLTDERGISTLKAAGLPCEEIGFNDVATPATPQPAPPAPPVQPQLQLPQPHPEGRMRNIRAEGHSRNTAPGKMSRRRWTGFAYVRLGDKKPAPGMQCLQTWSWHRIKEEMEEKKVVMLLRTRVNELLCAKYAERNGKPCTSSSSIVTGLLDKGWIVPVME